MTAQREFREDVTIGIIAVVIFLFMVGVLISLAISRAVL